jgi:hypothetical protein
LHFHDDLHALAPQSTAEPSAWSFDATGYHGNLSLRPVASHGSRLEREVAH